MIALELACRALLVVVIGTAAATKLRRSAIGELRGALVAFGLPRFATGTSAAVGVVAAELVAVALLAVVPLAGYAAAAVVLAVFTAGLVAALRARVRIACPCFGASTAPIGKSHVARNALLIAIAAGGAAARGFATGVSAPWPWLVLGAVLGAAITRWDDLAYVIDV